MYLTLEEAKKIMRSGLSSDIIFHLERKDRMLEECDTCAICGIRHGSIVDEDGQIHEPAARHRFERDAEPYLSIYLHISGDRMVCSRCLDVTEDDGA